MQSDYKDPLSWASYLNFPTTRGQNSHFCGKQFLSVKVAVAFMQMAQAGQFTWKTYQLCDDKFMARF